MSYHTYTSLILKYKTLKEEIMFISWFLKVNYGAFYKYLCYNI